MGYINEYLAAQRRAVFGMAALDCYFKVLGADAKVKRITGDGLRFEIKEEDYSANISLEHRILTFRLDVPGVKGTEIRNELGFIQNYFLEWHLISIYKDYLKRQKING